MDDATAGRLEDLVARLALEPGDESAWAGLHRLLWPFVFAIAYRMLDGNTAAAEDVGQEVFVRFAKYAPLGELTEAPAVRGYLRVITHNCAADHFRTRQLDERAPCEDGASFEDPEDYDTRDLLERLFGALPPAERQLVVKLAEGKTISQVASDLSITYQNAAVRIHRLRKKLKRARAGIS